VSGGDVKIYAEHIRKKELDMIQAETGAEVIYLDIGREKRDGGGQKARKTSK
jgi:hypothetical protein